MNRQTVTERRIPERRCAGCGERFPKSSLVRIVCGADGAAAVDSSMKAQSRGVYLCRNEKCLARALKSGRIASSVGARLDESSAELIKQAVLGTGDAK